MQQTKNPESPNTKTPRGDAEMLLRFGSAVGVPRSPVTSDLEAFIEPENGIPYLVAPDGYQVHSLEHLLPNPTRKRAAVTMLDAHSFIEYTKKHGSMDTCALYADVDYEASKCGIVAVINDHGSDVENAKWRDHTASFTPKLSIEWKRWTLANGAAMPQSKFAAFIEDNMADVASVNGSPSGAQMLEMALNFEATSDKRFKRRIDLQAGGVQLEYVDKADDATSTKLRMFERFSLGIPVFQGSSSAYPVECRLKFRQINDGLNFWFELVRPDRVFRQAVDDEIEIIRNKTGFMMLYGNAGLK